MWHMGQEGGKGFLNIQYDLEQEIHAAAHWNEQSTDVWSLVG